MEWLEKVKKEHKELTDKYVKLEQFIKSEKFKELDAGDRELLWEQKYIMERYIYVLVHRIAKAEQETKKEN